MAKSRVLVAGWFSIAGGHATVGDWLSLQSVCDALAAAGIPFDVSYPGDGNGTDYRVKVWVCGPVDRSYPPQHAFLGDGTGWILTSTTLITDRLDLGAADVSTARDGDGVPTRADLAYLATPLARGAFAAVMLRGMQHEYRTTQSHHERIRTAVHNAVLRAGMYPVELTTRVSGAASPTVLGAGLERVMKAAAVTITSRLHGVMHALCSGSVPVVVDEVPNGGKVTAFAREFGLPILLTAEQCTTERVITAIDEVCHIKDGIAGSILARARDSARDNIECMVSRVLALLAHSS